MATYTQYMYPVKFEGDEDFSLCISAKQVDDVSNPPEDGDFAALRGSTPHMLKPEDFTEIYYRPSTEEIESFIERIKEQQNPAQDELFASVWNHLKENPSHGFCVVEAAEQEDNTYTFSVDGVEVINV